MLAYDYPLLGVFWTLVLASLFILWIFIVIWAFIDNFRRKDHGGLAKALWFLFILFLPVLGVFIYIVARPLAADADVVVYEQETVSRP
jgi:4-amino-4-deoxy-L-arabinose transferase-like glycosyltransferase